MKPSRSVVAATWHPRIRRRHRRGGIYFAELILMMPVFLVLMLSVVQFGIFFSRLQIVDFAARVGAEAASESSVTGEVPGSVLTAVNQHLASNGMTQCRVIVQQVGGETSFGTCPCSPSAFTTPPGMYVRVSVCVLQSELMPNLLAPFGYDISGSTKVVSCATTMQQEF